MVEEDAISAVRKGENLTVQDVTSHVQMLCVRLKHVLGQGDYPSYATHGDFGHVSPYRNESDYAEHCQGKEYLGPNFPKEVFQIQGNLSPVGLHRCTGCLDSLNSDHDAIERRVLP